MKNLLYIDPFCEYGHNNLNRVYINSFMELGINVHLVLKEGHVQELQLPEELVRLAIPFRYFRGDLGKLGNRFYLLKILLYIKSRIDFRNYDYVFFSGYEEISLYLSGIKGRLILVNHANVSGLDSYIKRMFIKLISNSAHITHIVFAQYIKDRFAEFGISNVLVKPLGLSEPYEINRNIKESILRSIDERIVSNKFKYRIFAPSGSKYGSDFIEKQITDINFISFLEQNKILLIIKDEHLFSNSSNVLVLNNFLSISQYQALFLESDIILICYPETFNYRVSAIFFESLSNNKVCLLSDIEAFRVFESHFNYNPYFNNVHQFMKVVTEFIMNRDAISCLPYNNLESLNPTFKELIKVKE